MNICPFQPEDREAIVEIRDATFGPEKHPTPVWQPSRQVESLDLDGFKIVCRDGRVVAYAAAYQLDDTHFRFNLMVDPEYRLRGVASQLLEQLESHVVQAGIKYVQLRVDEKIDAGPKFAEARGFREVHRMRGMSLDAESSTISEGLNFTHGFADQKYRLTTLHDELAAGENPLQRLAQFQLAAQEGWPSPDPTQKRRVTVEETIKLFGAITRPDLFVILKHGDEYVGYTSTQEGPGTAVHPAHRNRGLAKLMKANAIRLAIAAGYKHFETCSANPAMQWVNEQLGFRFDGRSEVRFVKEL